MPRFTDDIVICGRTDDSCVDDVTARINAQKNESFICECLPACFEINYDASVSMAPILHEAPILKQNGHQEQNVSVMHIYYQKNYFRSQKKDELIGFTEFLCEWQKKQITCPNVHHHCTFFVIYSKYGRFVGTFHGFLGIFYCRSILFSINSAI